MIQIDPQIWNKIAETQQIQNPILKQIMMMESNQMLQTIDKIGTSMMEKMQLPSKVVTAYLQVMPLLEENEAISNYLNQTKQEELRQVLLEILTPMEAVQVMEQEHRLNNQQSQMLLNLLQDQEKKSQILKLWKEVLMN